MRKNRIRLTESQLHKVIEESVNRVLNENQGFMDGVKGAWNGFKGGWDQGAGMRGLKQGYQQGAQGQQQQSINQSQRQLPILLRGIGGFANEAIKAMQQNDYEMVKSEVESIMSNCEDIMNIIQPQSVLYNKNGKMDNPYGDD